MITDGKGITLRQTTHARTMPGRLPTVSWYPLLPETGPTQGTFSWPCLCDTYTRRIQQTQQKRELLLETRSHGC